MNTPTPDQLPADWSPAVRDAFWTAVNAPSYEESTAATLAFARLLAHAAPVPSVDRAALRQRIADALAEADGWVFAPGFKDGSPTYQGFLRQADAVLAVPADRAAEELASLAVNAANALRDEKRHYEIACEENARLRAEVERLRADRAAVLLEAIRRVEDPEERAKSSVGSGLGWEAARDVLRRMAAEAQPAEAHVCGNCEGVDPNSCLNNPDRPAAEAQPATPDTEALAALFEGFQRLLATSSRDWGQYRVDAWLYAVICGWDCEQTEHDETCVHGALEEMAALHGWDDAAVAKARRYRAAVRALTEPVGSAAAPAKDTPLCGKTRGLGGFTYKPCARDAGHKEAYCRSADGIHLFLAAPPMDPARILGVDADDAPETDTPAETVHGCPPPGSSRTPCCDRLPWELPRTDRISSERPVTCPGRPS
ncbi:hypothetical protein SUDANB145_07274 (plasmid) [Streptomyces sp. enrichment culture]|uniref:hypothetical protein n=1 Tax=Streptomyces sp. enrichment culture TaxID=1795815 RepID=UPI003F55C3E6